MLSSILYVSAARGAFRGLTAFSSPELIPPCRLSSSSSSSSSRATELQQIWPILPVSRMRRLTGSRRHRAVLGDPVPGLWRWPGLNSRPPTPPPVATASPTPHRTGFVLINSSFQSQILLVFSSVLALLAARGGWRRRQRTVYAPQRTGVFPALCIFTGLRFAFTRAKRTEFGKFVK